MTAGLALTRDTGAPGHLQWLPSKVSMKLLAHTSCTQTSTYKDENNLIVIMPLYAGNNNSTTIFYIKLQILKPLQKFVKYSNYTTFAGTDGRFSFQLCCPGEARKRTFPEANVLFACLAFLISQMFSCHSVFLFFMCVFMIVRACIYAHLQP